MKKGVWFLLIWSAISALPVLAECPSMDVTGDCFVDLGDFAVFAEQWLTGDRLPEDMVSIRTGSFQMGGSFNEGGPDELPVHTVNLDSFAPGKHEVTNSQYRDFLNGALHVGMIYVSGGVVFSSVSSQPYCDTNDVDPGSHITFSDGIFGVSTKGGRSMVNDPMVMVTWYGAAGYCNWRSVHEGREPCYDLSTWECDFGKNGYRLPTEAQWEYAARGGLSSKRFPWGDTISHSQANYFSFWPLGSPYYPYDVSPTEGYHPDWDDGFEPYTSPVGSFPANGYGLHDVAGNVFEWCNDWYLSTYYSTSPQTNPTGPPTGTYRVLRGGVWHGPGDSCRVSSRDCSAPSNRTFYVGFRLVLDSN